MNCLHKPAHRSSFIHLRIETSCCEVNEIWTTCAHRPRPPGGPANDGVSGGIHDTYLLLVPGPDPSPGGSVVLCLELSAEGVREVLGFCGIPHLWKRDWELSSARAVQELPSWKGVLWTSLFRPRILEAQQTTGWVQRVLFALRWTPCRSWPRKARLHLSVGTRTSEFVSRTSFCINHFRERNL